MAVVMTLLVFLRAANFCLDKMPWFVTLLVASDFLIARTRIYYMLLRRNALSVR